MNDDGVDPGTATAIRRPREAASVTDPRCTRYISSAEDVLDRNHWEEFEVAVREAVLPAFESGEMDPEHAQRKARAARVLQRCAWIWNS